MASTLKDSNITYTGHSLGGVLAELLAIEQATTTGEWHQTVTFNSPGADGFTIKNYDSNGNVMDVQVFSTENLDSSLVSAYMSNHIISEDLIGNYGNHPGEVNVMPVEGIMDSLIRVLRSSLDYMTYVHSIEQFTGSRYPRIEYLPENQDETFRRAVAELSDSERMDLLKSLLEQQKDSWDFTQEQWEKMFNDFFNFKNYLSPIVLDLDNDGIETVGPSSIYFDLDANGFPERVGWVGADDGLLVLDRNGNGLIDSGRELFGDQTVLQDGSQSPGGFQALSELDENRDGVINASDAAYSQLRVWRDSNQDGISQSGELYTLSELAIQSVNTNYVTSDITDEAGNIKTQIGSFTKSDGTEQEMSDYLFQHNTMQTISTELLPVPEDIALLPDVAGKGTVYSLQQAMVRDSSGALQSLSMLLRILQQNQIHVTTHFSRWNKAFANMSNDKNMSEVLNDIKLLTEIK
jgi:hypothetical protein